MERTPEHEQLIDELTEKSGLRREVVEEVTDEVLSAVMRQLIDMAAEKVRETGPVILTNEYVVPKRTAARFRHAARAIRSKSR